MINIYKILITILIFNNTLLKSQQLFISKENNSDNDTNIRTIMQQYFQTKECLTFIYLSQNIIIPDMFFTFTNVPKVIKKYNGNFKPNYNITYRPRRDFYLKNGKIEDFCLETNEGFILFSPNIEVIRQFMFSYKAKAFWYPKAKFFVYLLADINSTNIKNISSLMNKLWNIYRIAYLSVTCSTCTHVFTFTPTSRAIDSRYWGVTRQYTITEVLNNWRLLETNLNNLNRYPIIATLFPSVMCKKVLRHSNNKTFIEFEGIDASFLSLLSEKMNFTKIIKIPGDNEQYGRRLLNGSYTGGLGAVVTGQTDLVPVGYFSKDYGTFDAEFLGANMGDDDLCAVVHKTKMVPAWLAPVKFIGYDVCILLGGVYLGVAIIWIIIKKFLSNATPTNDTSLIFLNTLRLMLTASIPHISETTSERLFLACCMAAFVTFAGTFQGSLVTVYSTLYFFPNINTLKELSETGMPILTRFESFKNDVFIDESNQVRSKLKNMIQIYDGKPKINSLIAEFGNVGGLTRKTSMTLDNDTNFYDSKGNNLLHIVKECARTYGITYIIPRASPFYHRMNQLVLQANQAGLFIKWFEEMARNNTKNSSKLKPKNQGNSEDNRPLALEDLQLAVFQLIIGLSLSCIVFIFEIAKLKLLCKIFQYSRRKYK